MPSLPLSIPLIIRIPKNFSMQEDDQSVSQEFDDCRDYSCNRWEEDCCGRNVRHEATTSTKKPPKAPRRVGSGNMFDLLDDASDSEQDRGDHSPKLPRRSWTLGDDCVFPTLPAQDTSVKTLSPKTERTRSLPDRLFNSSSPKIPLRRLSATEGAVAA